MPSVGRQPLCDGIPCLRTRPIERTDMATAVPLLAAFLLAGMLEAIAG
jgi:hypothetical protein